jgi:hypothetical protein
MKLQLQESQPCTEKLADIMKAVLDQTANLPKQKDHHFCLYGMLAYKDT